VGVGVKQTELERGAEEIEITPRDFTKEQPGAYRPYRTNGCPVPEFARAGDGYRFHATGLTHDERGYPTMSLKAQADLVGRLIGKIRGNVERIIHLEEVDTAGADVVVVAYGITARVARKGIELARKEQARVGLLRLITAWPFPERRISELAGVAAAFVVPEINCGQMVREVERAAAGRARVVSVPHAGGGVHDPETIAAAIVRATT